MMTPMINFLKKHWMVIAAALVVVAIVMIFMSKKENYYDYEIAGCSTCNAGDAGVFDYEEAYQMPDDYYNDAEEDMYKEDAEDADMTFAEEVMNDEDAEDDMAEVAEDAEDADMTFAEEVMNDEDDELEMLDVDELDAEEDVYAEL